MRKIGSMSRLAVVILISVACAAPPRPVPSIAAASTEVLALIADYDRAWSTKDRVRLTEILDPSYIYFTSRGAMWSRDRVDRKSVV